MIPVVDLSDFVGGSTPQRRLVAEAVDRACVDIGFFTVVGHGVAADLVARVQREALAFFDLPVAERLAVAVPEPGYPYGYRPVEAEALSRSIGGDLTADLKESFNVGPIDAPPRPLDAMDDLDERAVYAPNLWPAALPGLRPAVEDYYRAMADLSATLMEIFAVALGLEARAFDRYIDRHASALRLAHYPATDVNASSGRLRAGAHTDYGIVTVLWADAVPGLEILDRDGNWHPVLPAPGALLVNLGDLLARWTNDRWLSTMHRVVPPTDAAGRSLRRRSAAYFHDGNADALISTLDTCRAPDGSADYDDITVAEHLAQKLAGSRGLELNDHAAREAARISRGER